MQFGVGQPWFELRLLWLGIENFRNFSEPCCSDLYRRGQCLSQLERLKKIVCVAISNENGDGYLLTWRQHWNERLQ